MPSTPDDPSRGITEGIEQGIERVGAAPTPPPYAPELERAWLPDRDDIADAIRRLAAV